MDQKTYTVADGVDWVNGKKVPDNRQVILTKQEALFDLSLGRISLRKPERTKSSKSTANNGKAADKKLTDDRD